MVFYFESRLDGLPPFTLYMGKDKEENEELIKYGWDTDIWFHADNLSSAHVYLRLPSDYEWTNIPEAVLIDCAQLTKANSIQGNKKDNVKILYTPWANLHKNGSMATGQVGFKSEKQHKKIHIKTRDNAIINRLNKTRQELTPDLEEERLEHEKQQRAQWAEEHRARHKLDLETQREYRKLAEEKDRAYTNLFDDESMRHSSNQFRADDWEEDFM